MANDWSSVYLVLLLVGFVGRIAALDAEVGHHIRQILFEPLTTFLAFPAVLAVLERQRALYTDVQR